MAIQRSSKVIVLTIERTDRLYGSLSDRKIRSFQPIAERSSEGIVANLGSAIIQNDR